MGLIVSLATPIADLFPAETFDKLSNPVFVALLLLMGVSFLFGLALRSDLLTSFGRFLEENTLVHLPLYNAVGFYPGSLPNIGVADDPVRV